MTKKVRIENADMADYKVVVEVWDKGALMPDGMGGFNQAHDVKAFELNLDWPTAMTGDDVYLTSTRYIVIKEA